MSKGSGGTKNSTWRKSDIMPKWSGETDFDSILNDSIKIFKYEASKGLGNYEKGKPQIVSSNEYNAMLASGEYIEVRHGGLKQDNNSLIAGSYHYPTDVHLYGPGYYFRGSNKGHSYASDPDSSMITALIKKSDAIRVSALQDTITKGQNQYLGNGIANNGKKISKGDYKDLYARSTAAARTGHKVLFTENQYNDFVVIDRSALIIKKSK